MLVVSWKVCCYQYGQSTNSMPRGTKTMKSNQLLCGRGVPCKDEDLKREISLNPVFLIMIAMFIHEMYEDMPSMHKIHVGKNSENYAFIMSH